jgi:hypothetical protein
MDKNINSIMVIFIDNHNILPLFSEGVQYGCLDNSLFVDDFYDKILKIVRN